MGRIARRKIKRIVSIDGKSLRGTKDQINNLGPLQMVNIWCCENQLVLGQEVVDGKSNEITAISKLLELLELEGAIVPLDVFYADFYEKFLLELLPF